MEVDILYYKIEDGFKEQSSLEGYTGDVVTIITEKELKSKLASKEIDSKFVPNYKNAKCCRADVHKGCFSLTFSVVSKDKKRNRLNFGCIIKKDNVIFIDDSGIVKTCIKKMQKNKISESTTLERFLYDFLETLIDSDLRYMEEMGDRLTRIESAVVKGILDDFNKNMIDFRKEALMFYRYYTQLSDIGQEFQENENGFFSDKAVNLFGMFTIRADRLREEAHILRDYSSQVRDIYHSQTDAKQNKIMKVLTVVTTVLMPISILSAWYGMNFDTMPELHWSYGYIAFIIASILTTFGSVWYLKKKKFW